jgi:hypothetical protein
MSMKLQNERDTEMSTLRPGDSYHRGLRILARMIAHSYLEEKLAQCSQKEMHSGAHLIPEEGNNESWQGSKNESRSSDDEH